MLDPTPSLHSPAKTLLLMRHAKSSWSDERLTDFNRPLNGRGTRAARAMAPLVAAWQPQWIGCSLAQRTRETLIPIVALLEAPADIALTADLYEASEAAYLRRIRALAGTVDRALIIGHNPVLEDLCSTLIGSAEPHLVERIANKLPTGTLIVLECPTARWPDLAPGCASLIDVIRPRDVAETAD